MTKLERAIEEAEQLPTDLQEQIGDELLHYIHKYLALRNDLQVGIAELDAGLGLDGEDVFAELRTKYGA